ncbi:MAG: NAD-binding protein [Candidatus Lokiarchaeota archaeon]
MASKYWIKFKTVIAQNSYAFLIVFIWFLGNFLYFAFETGNWIIAVQIIFYFKPQETLYGNFYASFTEFIIFGLVFSLITIELFRKYNPIETCEKLAHDMKDHIIIIGYTHIGQRLNKHLESIGKEVVIVETQKSKVEELIDQEKPLVIDTDISNQTLLNASVKEAKAVFILTDDLEILMVGCSAVRKYNKSCKLVCRVFEDDIAQVLANTFNTQTISTSKYASDVIMEEIHEKGYKNIIIIGLTHISARIIASISKGAAKINYFLIEEDEEKVENYIFEDNDHIIIGDPKETLLLKKANIESADLVINTHFSIEEVLLITKRIRDLNSKCKIISRIFSEHIADIISKPPFKSEVISSSKTTLKIMLKHNMLKI